jgi:hypothetical protein
MDTTNFGSNDFSCDDGEPTSLPTVLPAPPRMPNFVPVSVRVTASRPRLALVASNPSPSPMQTRATVPALRLITVNHPSAPPPSIPPTGSTPIRRAA